MAPQPDRALRRLITKLAELGEADRVAVLDSLSAAQAAEVGRMLGGYQGLSGAPNDRAAPGGAWAGLGLSPTLMQRLETGEGDLAIPGSGRSPGPVILSPQTLATLRRLAGDLDEVGPVALPPVARPPGLLRRLGLVRDLR